MYIIFKYITDRIIIIETKFLNNIFQYRYVFFKCSLNIPFIIHTENVWIFCLLSEAIDTS